MIFWLFVGVLMASIVLLWLNDRFDWDCDILCGVAFVSCVLSSIVAVIMLMVVVFNNVSAAGTAASLRSDYEVLSYQYNNNMYDNDNDIGLQSLMENIQEYNSTISDGRALQNDYWMGIFYPDIYDDLELIELK